MGGSRTYTQLLRCNRFFRRLWSGQVISELGNWFNFIAALGLVRAVSNAAPEVTTILLIARLLAGVMPALLWSCVMVCLSLVFLGAHMAVQETLMMRLAPDDLRGRVSMLHHAGEILIAATFTGVAGWSLQWLTPRSLTVIAGLVSGTAGLAWLAVFLTRGVRLPKRLKGGLAGQAQPAEAGD